MGKHRRTDFAVDSEGQCFLCSNKIFTSPFPKVIRDEAEVSQSNPIYSFHNVSKYLNMEMTKVFSETGGIPPQLLAKVQASKLKVELCEGCAALNETFSKLYRRLEKIEMEVASCANQMYGKLAAAKEKDRDSSMVSVKRDVSEKSKILNALRTEASEKCSTKLAVGSPSPRIKLRKLTLKQVNAARSKLFQSSSHPNRISRSNQDSGSLPIENLKDETMDDSNFITYDDDDTNANNDFDEYDGEPNEYVDGRETAMQFQTDGDGGAYSIQLTRKDEAMPKIKIDETLYTVSAETGKYKCNSCSKELKDLKCFGSHYRTMHLKIRYKCSMCGKVLQTNTNYNRHVQNAHLGIKFKCQGCGKSYGQKYKLKTHQLLSGCGVSAGARSVKK